jgi:hypothetical protein
MHFQMSYVLPAAGQTYIAIQVLALFNKAIRKLHGHLRAVKEAQVERQLPRPGRLTAAAAATAATAADAAASGAPLLGEGVDVSLDEELEEAARVEREKLRQLFRPEDLQQFAITGARQHQGMIVRQRLMDDLAALECDVLTEWCGFTQASSR